MSGSGMDLDMNLVMLDDFIYDLAAFEQHPLGQEEQPEESPHFSLEEASCDVEPSCDVEGKLFIRLKNLQCQHIHKRWYQKFTCVCVVDGFEQKIPLKKSAAGGTYDAEAVAIFDIYEYFGPSKVSITLQQTSSSNSHYTYCSSLHELCSRQDVDRLCVLKTEETTNHEENENNEASSATTAVGDGFPHSSYWRGHEKIKLVPSTKKSSPMRKTSPLPVSCELYFTYTPVKSYLATGAEKDENYSLRSVVCYGSHAVLCDVLETLSRNSLLRRALAIRTPAYRCNKCKMCNTCSSENWQEPSVSVGFLPLEHALLARNKPAVEVLLRRTGNWCFQSTGMKRRIHKSIVDREYLSVDTQRESVLNILPEFLTRHHYFAPYQIPSPPTPVGYHHTHMATIGCALHAAVMGGEITCLSMLLRFIKKYKSDIIEWYTDNHADMINWVGARSDGFTPLMLACALGRTDCIRMLLSEGATLEVATEPYRLTPLMLACSSGSLEAVAELLSHVNTVDSSLSPIIRNHLEKDTVSLMKCSPYVENIDGKQALGIAAEAGHNDIVAYLIAKKVSYSHQDMFGNTALHLAAANAHSQVCATIIKAEAAAVHQFNKRNFNLRAEKDVYAMTMTQSKGDQSQNADKNTCKEKSDGFSDDIQEIHITEKVFGNKEDESAESSSSTGLHDTAYTHLDSADKTYISLPMLPESSDITYPQEPRSQCRVLDNMTPRHGILRAVDKRGRTAATLAAICGHDDTATMLRNAEVEEQRENELYMGACLPSRAGATRQGHGVERSGVLVADERDLEDENGDDNDAADNIAYKFAKTLYFDPSYDAIFNENNNGGANTSSDCSESDGEDSIS